MSWRSTSTSPYPVMLSGGGSATSRSSGVEASLSPNRCLRCTLVPAQLNLTTSSVAQDVSPGCTQNESRRDGRHSPSARNSPTGGRGQSRMTKSYECATCGQIHAGLPMSFAAEFPDQYANMAREVRDTRTVISSDQCIIDQQWFFIRGCLDIPILGSDEPFLWACGCPFGGSL